jgi:hypothetical protein
MAHEKPHSFLKGGGAWTLRTKRSLLAQIRAWRDKPDAAGMQAAGINKLVWALMEQYFPGVNPANIAPQDLMHALADGITRHEAVWLLYMLHSRDHLKLPMVNHAILKYPWPRDCRVPRLPDNVKDGENGNFPRQQATLGLSASQTFTFALHRYGSMRCHSPDTLTTRLPSACSIALLSPLLSDEAKQTPYWKAWVAHVRMLEMSLRSSFSLADVTRLDELIMEHHRLFLRVRVPQCVSLCVTPQHTHVLHGTLPCDFEY